MARISYRRHCFPPVVIQHALWLYLRFTLSYRDAEELLAERGLDISYESIRSWVLKFGPANAGSAAVPSSTERSLASRRTAQQEPPRRARPERPMYPPADRKFEGINRRD